jgi:hypothetical protein
LDSGLDAPIDGPADTGLDGDAPIPDAMPDADAEVSEICNGEDDDGDGNVDEGLETHERYQDADGDGYGSPRGESQTFCVGHPAVDGWELSTNDCDDMDVLVNPMAVEVCDAADNDCDGLFNEGVCDEGCSGHTRVTADGSVDRYQYCDDAVSWFDAGERCRALGGNLTIINDDVEWAWMRSKHTEVTGGARHTAWIGLRRDRSGETDRWLRVDGVHATFFAWFTDGPVQPDDAWGGEECVEMFFRGDRDGGWNDLDCGPTRRRYWCEFH